MVITIGMIYNSIDALKQVQKFKIDVLKAYQLQKLVREIQTEIDGVENIRKDLIKKYGFEINVKDENGEDIGTGDYKVKPENQDVFMAELSILFEKEIVLQELEQAKLSIQDLSGNKIETEKLNLLSWLIEYSLDNVNGV